MVLADGRMLHNLNKLKKDNTGYDLKNLFIGAEGTLGVITAAVLRLLPRPRSVETAFVGVPSPEAALDLLGLATERTAGGVTSFELMLRMGVEMALKHGAGCRDPLPHAHPWYVLIELSSQQRSGLRDVMEEILADGLERGLIEDATIAESIDQGKMFWRIRELFGEVQRHEGGSIKHDVSVPVAAVPAFIKQAERRRHQAHSRMRGRCRSGISATATSTTTSPAGRRGQGRVPGALARRQRGRVRGGGEIRRLDLGRARHRRDQARSVAEGEGPGGVELMRTLKRTLDPKGILNPGKVL